MISFIFFLRNRHNFDVLFVLNIKARQGSLEELFSIDSDLSVEAELTDSTFVCFSVAFSGARRNVRLCSMHEDKTTSVGFEKIFQRASEEKRYL